MRIESNSRPDPEGDDPLGPLHEAAPGVEAERLGLGPLVGDQHRRREDGQGQHGDPAGVGGGQVPGHAAEQQRVGDAVGHGVEEGATGAGGAGRLGHRAVEQVGQRAQHEQEEARRAARRWRWRPRRQPASMTPRGGEVVGGDAGAAEVGSDGLQTRFEARTASVRRTSGIPWGEGDRGACYRLTPGVRRSWVQRREVVPPFPTRALVHGLDASRTSARRIPRHRGNSRWCPASGTRSSTAWGRWVASHAPTSGGDMASSARGRCARGCARATGRARPRAAGPGRAPGPATPPRTDSSSARASCSAAPGTAASSRAPSLPRRLQHVFQRELGGERLGHQVGRHLGGQLPGAELRGQLHEGPSSRPERGHHVLVRIGLHGRDGADEPDGQDPVPQHRGGRQGAQAPRRPAEEHRSPDPQLVQEVAEVHTERSEGAGRDPGRSRRRLVGRRRGAGRRSRRRRCRRGGGPGGSPGCRAGTPPAHRPDRPRRRPPGPPVGQRDQAGRLHLHTVGRRDTLPDTRQPNRQGDPSAAAFRPRRSATSPWSATGARARRPWPRRSSTAPVRSPASAASRTASPCATTIPRSSARGLSLSLAVAPFEWKGHKVNLIDTPGYADFVGDVAAALRVVDLAVFVVSRGRRRRGADGGHLARGSPPRACPGWCSSTSSTASGPASSAPSTSCATASAPASRPSSCPSATRPASGASPTCSPTPPTSTTAACRTRSRSPTTWRPSSTRSTTTWSRASSWPTTRCSSATSRATCPTIERAGARPHPRHRGGHRVPGGLRLGHRRGRHRPAGRLHLEIGPPPDRPPDHGHGRRRRGRGARRPGGRPAGVRVQDDRRPLRRPALAASRCCPARSATTTTS